VQSFDQELVQYEVQKWQVDGQRVLVHRLVDVQMCVSELVVQKLLSHKIL
ncbi:hypothetical protein A2U01_0082709, partial [Trifolium medium]|nr:hypothetical protein [Trifolium medium]